MLVLHNWKFFFFFFFFTCCLYWTQACNHEIGYISGPIGSLFAITNTYLGKAILPHINALGHYGLEKENEEERPIEQHLY